MQKRLLIKIKKIRDNSEHLLHDTIIKHVSKRSSLRDLASLFGVSDSV